MLYAVLLPAREVFYLNEETFEMGVALLELSEKDVQLIDNCKYT